jgi:trigger factor
VAEAMKVEVRREPQSRAVLEVELPAEAVAEAMREAHRRLARRVNIPGFRRGRAPAALVERYVGRDGVVDETLKLLLPRTVFQAMEQVGLEPISRPEIDVDERQVSPDAPLRFTATVEVAPEVDPGPYREVRVPRPAQTLEEGVVDRALEDLRLRHATLVASGEPAAPGDFVLVRVLEGPAGAGRLQAGKEYLVEIGSGTYPEALEQGLVGARPGEERRLPGGNSDEVLVVLVSDVKRRELPPLDDALARLEGAESLAALRAQVESRLAADAARGADEAYAEAVLREVLRRATVDLPRSMVAHEAAHLREDLEASLRRRGLTLETYRRAAEKSMEEVEADLTAAAEGRLRTRLVLDAIARREGLEPTEEEMAAEVENLAQSLGQDASRVREWLDRDGRRDALAASLRRRKTMQFLLGLAAAAEGAAPPPRETREEDA